jgi:Holliday junction resolvase-like predicted endonuclease
MSVEKDLIIAILKLTRNGAVSHELVNKEAKMPSQIGLKLLQKMQNGGLIYASKPFVEVETMQRLGLAVRAISLGADLERVSTFLQWQEFEGMAAVALERNGYNVARNLRFTHAGRKWEIDIVGCKKPLAVCIDCKHWHHGMHPSALKRAVDEQVGRVKALAESLPNPSTRLECTLWNEARFIPVVLSLVASRFKFIQNVPIVPILQLQDFLTQLPAYANSFTHFSWLGQRFQNRFSSES